MAITKIKPYLELVRLPAVFSAQADILAGFFISGAGIFEGKKLILLILASSFLYSAGMALNDFFDHRIDLKERSFRPIPSGRIKKENALLTAILLLLCGVITASFVNQTSFIISIILTGAIIAYDSGIKKLTWAGPLNMGICRYLNFLLGLSILPLHPAWMLIPLITGSYIFGLSVLSKQETIGHDPVGIIICAVSLAYVFVLYKIYAYFAILPNPVGAALCLALVLILATDVLHLFFRPLPDDYQKTIKRLLWGLIILDGIIVAGTCPFIQALAVWMMLLPALAMRKWFYIT